MMHMLILSSGRKLVLVPLALPIDYSFNGPFAALLPAFDVSECRQVEAIAGSLMDQGCIEFCCVGPQAEQLHESLDGLSEDRGSPEVATTWHTDYSDACEYFLFAAGGGLPTLIALLLGHPDLTALLDAEARAA